MHDDKAILNVDFKPHIHYDKEMEYAVLGAILIDKNCFVRVYSMLTEEMFWFDDCRFLFRTLKWMFDRNMDIDILTVAHFALSKGMDKWEKISGESFGAFISRTTMHILKSAHIETHVLILRELWAARELTTIQVQAGTDTSMDNAIETQKRLQKIFDVTRQDEWLSIEEVITTRLMKRMDDVKAGKTVSFITGIQSMDRLCPVDGGDFVIIGARPSQGKTALAMQLATNFALNDAVVGVLSLETISERLAGRLISGASTLEYWKIWKNKLNDNEYQQFFKATDKFTNMNLFINDRPSATAMDIKISAHKLKNRFKDKKLILIIDYLQLITTEKSKQSQRHQEIGEISRALRLLTMELKDTAVVALAQLNRESERDGSVKRPKPSNLRESGSLEQDADKIWLLHRDTANEEELRLKEGKIDDYDAELIVAKNKEGWIGTIEMYFSPERMIFKDKESIFTLTKRESEPTNYYEVENDEEETPF